MYGAVAAVVVVIIVVAAAAWYFTGGNGGSDESGETGDSYYVYLDGMGEANGWHEGVGATPYEGITDAFENDGVEYDIGADGWVSSIAGLAYDGTNGFGVFVYTSSVLENPFEGYFGAGPTVSTVAGNIIYISYGGYDANYNSILTPSSTESDVMGTGPFATA